MNYTTHQALQQIYAGSAGDTELLVLLQTINPEWTGHERSKAYQTLFEQRNVSPKVTQTVLDSGNEEAITALAAYGEQCITAANMQQWWKQTDTVQHLVLARGPLNAFNDRHIHAAVTADCGALRSRAILRFLEQVDDELFVYALEGRTETGAPITRINELELATIEPSIQRSWVQHLTNQTNSDTIEQRWRDRLEPVLANPEYRRRIAESASLAIRRSYSEYLNKTTLAKELRQTLFFDMDVNQPAKNEAAWRLEVMRKDNKHYPVTGSNRWHHKLANMRVDGNEPAGKTPRIVTADMMGGSIGLLLLENPQMGLEEAGRKAVELWADRSLTAEELEVVEKADAKNPQKKERWVHLLEKLQDGKLHNEELSDLLDRTTVQDREALLSVLTNVEAFNITGKQLLTSLLSGMSNPEAVLDICRIGYQAGLLDENHPSQQLLRLYNEKTITYQMLQQQLGKQRTMWILAHSNHNSGAVSRQLVQQLANKHGLLETVKLIENAAQPETGK